MIKLMVSYNGDKIIIFFFFHLNTFDLEGPQASDKLQMF